MVPARSLPHLVRRNHAAHGATTAAAIRCDDDVVTPPREPTRYMAQEPINHHQHQHDPPKPPPPPRETDDHRIQGREPPLEQPPTQNQRLQLQLGGDGQHHHHRQQQQQEVAGTSGSSSGGSSSNGGGGNNGGARDWLRLGTGPASPGASGSDHDHFASDNRATTTTTAPAPPTLTPRHHDVLVLPGMPPGSFLLPGPAMPGIPQASIPTHMPRAAPPWLPPWSPAATAPPPLLPFAHDRAFYAAAAAPTTPASSGFDAIRVVLPPSAITAVAGVWFVLQAAPHQGREPFLPQIPRSYLRIKDGRVTVRLLTKYLVNKLGLEDESEVEITCRGRQLLPILTLQHVRDSIWCRRDAVSPSSVQAPDISTADHHHIMVLQYGRRP